MSCISPSSIGLEAGTPAQAYGNPRVPLDSAPERRPSRRGTLATAWPRPSSRKCRRWTAGRPYLAGQYNLVMASKRDPTANWPLWVWSTQPLDPNGWHPAGRSWLCRVDLGEFKAKPAWRRSAWPSSMIFRASVFFGASYAETRLPRRDA